LGGQSGADADCAAAASGAGLSGTFKAWLSTSTLNASAKLGTARGFVRTDGQPFADRVSDIVAGTIFNALDVDENGEAADSEFAWTGTLNAGTVGTETCSDWTSSSSSSQGVSGITVDGPQQWTDSGASLCNETFAIYCFDTSHVTPLTVTRTSGRIAFVSATGFDAGSGIAAADTICASEASAASLTGTFQALLSTSTAPAASRFNLSAASEPYVRPDGIEIADATTIASGDQLDSGIWQNADGTYVTTGNNGAWTGGSTPSASTTTVRTCDDWSTNSSSSLGYIGSDSTADAWWSDGAQNPCNQPNLVYCLQK